MYICIIFQQQNKKVLRQVHKVACYVANVGRLCLMSLSLLFMLLLQIYMPAGVGMDASFFNEKKIGHQRGQSKSFVCRCLGVYVCILFWLLVCGKTCCFSECMCEVKHTPMKYPASKCPFTWGTVMLCVSFSNEKKTAHVYVHRCAAPADLCTCLWA